MTSPGAYPPTQVGQGNQNAIIAATPGEPLAEALAAELRNLGWNAVVTDQVGPYAREARLCVAPLTPTTLNSPAIASALATPVAALIPLMVGATPLPPGPWATQPLVFSGDPAQTARDIVAVANTLGGASSTIPSMQPPASGPAYPSTGMTTPYAPAAPSQPLQPYQVAPGYPTQAGYGQYPQGGAPYAQPAAPTKRRRWPMVVGIIVGVVLLLCVIGGAFAYMGLNKFAGQVSTGISQTETASAVTPTPEATATEAIPADYTLFTDSTDGYSIAYPNSWQKSATGSDVIFLDTSVPADMVVGAVPDNLSQSDIASTESQFFKSAAGGGKVSNVKGPTTVTLAGESWTQESADISTSGQTIHAVVLVANHSTRAYIVGYLAAKSNFSSLDTQYFQPMLNTISFQS